MASTRRSNLLQIIVRTVQSPRHPHRAPEHGGELELPVSGGNGDEPRPPLVIADEEDKRRDPWWIILIAARGPASGVGGDGTLVAAAACGVLESTVGSSFIIYSVSEGGF